MRDTDIEISQENVIHGNFRKHFLKRIAARIGSWRRQRQAIRQLHGMSDALLRDLGIERYEIEEVVRRGESFTTLHPVPQRPAVAPLKKAAA